VLGEARVALTGLDPACATCHFDPHGGRFTAGGARAREGGCAGCHTAETFRIPTVDADAHDAFAWRLTGAHRAVPCFRCHGELEQPAAEIRLLRVSGTPRTLELRAEHGRCADCHDTPHAGQFASRAEGGACDDCHTADAFRPASRFDHDRDSAFPLAGAHADVACARCHASRRDVAGTPVVLYRPTARRCRDCHAGPSPEGGTS
jgi:hypothetical protein